MIKILINEEEVVCSNNLTITEEMLSTSSVILKNCYPKTWEQDKDYISRYYFPKDYSKCEIYDIQQGEQGKNLLNINGGYQKGYYDISGQFISDNYSCMFNQYIPVEEITYCLSADWQMENFYFVLYDENKTFIKSISVSNEIEKSINNATQHAKYMRVGYKDGIDEISNELNEEALLMFELGSTRTDYEPYTPGVVENLIFCGVVKNTGNISLNPREPHFVDLQILDFKTMLSEGETLNYVISGKTILQAIQQVIESISGYGFVLGNVNIQGANDTMGAYSTLNKTAYDVFQYIADITQSRWTTRMISEDSVAIDFIDPLLQPKQNPIEYTSTYFNDNEIVDITFNYSTNDYRNKQIMISEEIIGNITQTETRISDGYTKTFLMENKIGTITSLQVNGQDVSFATREQIEQGYSAVFSYQPGENLLTAIDIQSAGSVIAITYYPIVRGREVINNSEEISRINTQTNRNGVISRYENRNDATTSSELAKIGSSYIKYKGSAEIILKLTSTKDLFNVCDIVSFNAPIEDLTKDYMIKRKEIDIYTATEEIFYTYELSSNFNSENAINFFDNQRAKNIGNIGEGETITRDIDIETEALIIFYDTNIQEISIDNLSKLDFALDAGLL